MHGRGVYAVGRHSGCVERCLALALDGLDQTAWTAGVWSGLVPMPSMMSSLVRVW